MKARAALCVLCACCTISCSDSPVADEPKKSDDDSKITAHGPEGSKISVGKGGREISVTDEKGNTFTSGAAVTESSLGLPFYSNSTAYGSGSAVTERDGKIVTTIMRKTSDPPAQVVAFYKDKVLNAKLTEENIPEADLYTATITGSTADGGEVEMQVRKLPGESTTLAIAVTRPK